MAELLIEDDNILVVRLTGWEQLGALRLGDVRVPLASVTSVRILDDARFAVKGIRAPGTGVPGRIALGTWRGRGSKDFVAVYRHDAGAVIELSGQPFSRLIVSGPLPDGLEETV